MLQPPKPSHDVVVVTSVMESSVVHTSPVDKDGKTKAHAMSRPSPVSPPRGRRREEEGDTMWFE